MFQVHFDNPMSEIQLRFFHGTADEWGWANTTTILDYDIQFGQLPEDDLIRSSTFFNGFKYRQSVAGFSIKLTRKVRDRKLNPKNVWKLSSSRTCLFYRLVCTSSITTFRPVCSSS